jgi:hypothetical protein
MTPWEKLGLLQKHALVVHVDMNEHRVYYDTLESSLATRDEDLFDASDADVKAECLRRGQLVVVQVYTVTPIGFYRVGHYDLGAAIDAVYDACRKDLPALPSGEDK